MSHDLATIGQQTAMFYHGEVPWHKLGKRLNGPATSKEAIKAASLDWKVTKAPLYIKIGAKFRQEKDRFATIRMDQKDPRSSPVLGIVGSTYVPLQNSNAFSWFDDIVGQKAAIYETAGALGKGERVWILAKLPTQIRVVGDDLVDKYLLLSNSHDGSSGVQVKFTPIRVVCQNTLTMALSDGRGISIHHNASMERNMKLAQVNLGIINDRFTKIEEGFKRISGVMLNSERLGVYVRKVFPDPPNKDDNAALRRSVESRQRSSELFESGYGNRLSGAKGTLWAAYNGVTEFVDHHIGKRTSAERRLDSAWFGNGYLTKARAFKVALALSNEWRN